MNCRENQVWYNWAYNIELRPSKICTPESFSDVGDLIRQAQRDGRKVRAIGSGWSFSDVLATNDYLVETHQLKGILGFLQRGNLWGHSIPGDPIRSPVARSTVLSGGLKDSVFNSNRRLVHVLAGTSIKELYLALENHRGYFDAQGNLSHPGDDVPGRGPWALPTMGGASGQTLAGVISTGTHGGDFNLPPIPDMVLAIQLIAPDGSHHWIEREGREAITDLDKMMAIDLPNLSRENIHYDDEWFNSVLVSMGCMGIIFSLIIEVREQFGLSEDMRETTWLDVRSMLASGEIFRSTRYSSRDANLRWIDHHPRGADREPQGLGLFINPYRLSDDYSSADRNPDRRVMLITHASSSEYDGVYTPPPGAGRRQQFHMITGFESAGNLAVTRKVIDQVIDMLRNSEGTGGYKVAYSVLDTSSGANVPILSLEIVVSTLDGTHVAYLDHILAIFDEILREQRRPGLTKFAGGINLRFTKPTTAFLGMQNSDMPSQDERFCHIEIIVMKEIDALGDTHQGHSAMENYSEDFIDRFEQATAEFGARLHWGQLSRTDQHDPLRYRFFGNWLRVRNALTDHGAITTFDNDFTDRHIRGMIVEPAPRSNWFEPFAHVMMG